MWWSDVSVALFLLTYISDDPWSLCSGIPAPRPASRHILVSSRATMCVLSFLGHFLILTLLQTKSTANACDVDPELRAAHNDPLMVIGFCIISFFWHSRFYTVYHIRNGNAESQCSYRRSLSMDRFNLMDTRSRPAWYVLNTPTNLKPHAGVKELTSARILGEFQPV